MVKAALQGPRNQHKWAKSKEGSRVYGSAISCSPKNTFWCPKGSMKISSWPAIRLPFWAIIFHLPHHPAIKFYSPLFYQPSKSLEDFFPCLNGHKLLIFKHIGATLQRNPHGTLICVDQQGLVKSTLDVESERIFDINTKFLYLEFISKSQVKILLCNIDCICGQVVFQGIYSTIFNGF